MKRTDLKKRILSISVGALLVVGGYAAGRMHSRPVYAGGQAAVPKTFGKCVGGYMQGANAVLIFEDANGGIHLVYAQNGLQMSLIPRTN